MSVCLYNGGVLLQVTVCLGFPFACRGRHSSVFKYKYHIIYIAVNHNYIVRVYGELPYFTKYVTTIGNIFLKEKMQQNM